MKRYFFKAILIAITLSSCTKDLDVGAVAALDESQVSNPEQAEGFVIAAYSQLLTPALTTIGLG